jgi:hypothetical protein
MTGMYDYENVLKYAITELNRHDPNKIHALTYKELPPPKDNDGTEAIVWVHSGIIFINRKPAATYVSDGSRWLMCANTERYYY